MKKFLIKIWETEENRNIGESDIVEINIKNIKQAIQKAKRIMEDMNYASLEVQSEDEQQSFYFSTPTKEEYLYDFYEKNIEEKIKLVVDLYFVENDINNLMDYGSDRDSYVMPTLSDLYKELMEKLNIPYSKIYTEDISDSKYETTIEFENGSSTVVDTSAWNNEEIIFDNLISIKSDYEKFRDSEIEKFDKKKYIEWKNQKLELCIFKYIYSGNICLQLYNNDELYGDITINLPGMCIDNDEVFINSITTDCGLEKKLNELGIIDTVLGSVSYNMGKYNRVKLNLEKLKEYDMEGYNKFISNSENIEECNELEM